MTKAPIGGKPCMCDVSCGLYRAFRRQKSSSCLTYFEKVQKERRLHFSTWMPKTCTEGSTSNSFFCAKTRTQPCADTSWLCGHTERIVHCSETDKMRQLHRHCCWRLFCGGEWSDRIKSIENNKLGSGSDWLSCCRKAKGGVSDCTLIFSCGFGCFIKGKEKFIQREGLPTAEKKYGCVCKRSYFDVPSSTIKYQKQQIKEQRVRGSFQLKMFLRGPFCLFKFWRKKVSVAFWKSSQWRSEGTGNMQTCDDQTKQTRATNPVLNILRTFYVTACCCFSRGLQGTSVRLTPHKFPCERTHLAKSTC